MRNEEELGINTIATVDESNKEIYQCGQKEIILKDSFLNYQLDRRKLTGNHSQKKN